MLEKRMTYMQLQITGRHLEITQSIKAYVEEKMTKLTRHFDHIMDGRIVLSIEHGKHIAEGSISVPGNDVIAKADGENMYAAIDSLQDKLDRQVTKLKEKTKSHKVDKDKIEQAVEVEAELEINED